MKNIIPLILQKKGMTQRDLIGEFGKRGKKVDPGFINRIISEKKKPPIWFIFGVSNILNCKIEEIFFPRFEEMFGSNN